MTPKDKQLNLYSKALPHKQGVPSPDRLRERGHPIQSHKYIVGQILFFSPSAFEATKEGAYSVVRLLPPDSGSNQYRLKSVADGHERVVHESELASE